MLMRMKKAALIVNPFSSRVSEHRLHQVEEALAPYAYIEMLPTRRRRHATQIARDAAENHDALFVYSGDGVFNEVLNGIERPVPLGFIPGGRTNVLPRALGLPRDPVAAARHLGESLDEERTRQISLGRANGRRFAFAAGVGFDAELVRRLEGRGRTRDGKLPGDLVVAWLIFRHLTGRRQKDAPGLELEGIGRAASALVANADPYTYAGPLGMHLVPGSGFDRGLAVVAPGEVGAQRVVSSAVRALAGHSPGADVLRAENLDRLEVVCDAPLPLHVDGEDLGDVEYVLFESEPDAVRVLV
jgi:diacylglycerol kinase family enzyme